MDTGLVGQVSALVGPRHNKKPEVRSKAGNVTAPAALLHPVYWGRSQRAASMLAMMCSVKPPLAATQSRLLMAFHCRWHY